MFATGETVGLTELIIDDTCLVSVIFPLYVVYLFGGKNLNTKT